MEKPRKQNPINVVSLLLQSHLLCDLNVYCLCDCNFTIIMTAVLKLCDYSLTKIM